MAEPKYYCCENCDKHFEVLDHAKVNGWVIRIGYENRVISDRDYRRQFINAYFEFKKQYPWVELDLVVAHDGQGAALAQRNDDDDDSDDDFVLLQAATPEKIQQVTQFYDSTSKFKSGFYFTTSQTQNTKINQKDELAAIWKMLNRADFCTAWGLEAIHIQATMGIVYLLSESG